MPPDACDVAEATLHVATRMWRGAAEQAGLGDFVALPAHAQCLFDAPLRHGGFGLTSGAIGEEASRAAYLSAAVLTQMALGDGPVQFRPFDGPLRERWATYWAALRAEAPALLPDAPAQLEDAQLGKLRHAHSAYNAWQAQRSHERRLAACTQTQRANLLSTACNASSAWLRAFPSCPQLTIPTHAFKAGVRRRALLSPLPPSAAPITCLCGAAVTAADTEHAHTCGIPHGLRIMRHDEEVSIWRNAMARAGIASTCEPLVSAVNRTQRAAAAAGRAGSARVRSGAAGALTQARRALRAAVPRDGLGDILFVDDGDMTVADVSVIHPGCPTVRAKAARAAGAAASERDDEKRRKYRGQGMEGRKFVPLSMETHGRLGAPAMKLLGRIARRAVQNSGGAVSAAQFVEGTLQELGACMCKYNARIERAVATNFCLGAGKRFMPGLARPSAEVTAAEE